MFERFKKPKLELVQKTEIPNNVTVPMLTILKALASETRFKILKYLYDGKNQPYISEIAKVLKMTEANISAQIKVLEEATIILTHAQTGNRGLRKVSEINPKYKELIDLIIGNHSIPKK